MKPTILCRPLYLPSTPRLNGIATLLLLAHLLLPWLPENRLSAQNPTPKDSFDPETILYQVEDAFGNVVSNDGEAN